MKKLVAVAAVGVALAGASPAQAVTHYSIKGSKAEAVTEGASRFRHAKCNEALDNSPADGIDSQIINVSGKGGTIIRANWTAEATISNTIGGGLTARFFNASCTELLTGRIEGSAKPGAWNIPAPAGTKWMVVNADRTLNVDLWF